MKKKNKFIQIIITILLFVVAVYCVSWLKMQPFYDKQSSEERFVLMVVVGSGWLTAFHYLVFSKQWENIKYRLLSSVLTWLIVLILHFMFPFLWGLGIGIIPAIMYLFIYYEYFWPIYELTHWGNIVLMSVCFEGYYLLLATWGGGILEPYVKRFFEKRILKKQKQRTLTDADRDNR
ncbi:hypothetical protein [Negativicoccus succinicivorans]|uniref:hypothetical protein n=1 Tax=Negativicoccus succinicivorans TaxID=620903 RepID=UPI002900F96C|nr:hypothetical protein [Negativicoccus succinicivorans]MDU2418331.1 hypothetical protein [Negativicoccus succinicivorans]